ncbi:MAG: TetR/AcrR family transcriptional regulator [Pseudomonadota bacterium]
MQAQPPNSTRNRYHHGDLRAALIEAATRIITKKRVEDFKVADAAREIGVSSGAPYRHFKDKDDLLAHVAAAGFEALSCTTQNAIRRHPEGSVEGLIDGGCAYVTFVSSRPELFHLMWGAARPHGHNDIARETGTRCYLIFMDSLKKVMETRGLGHLEPHAFGAPLWAMVHGFASLVIGENDNLERTPEALRRHITSATRAYFDGSAAKLD